MLQIAFAPNTAFGGKSYDKQNNVVRACRTNYNYILNHLHNYKIKSAGEVGAAEDLGEDYQYLIFELK